MLKTLVIHNQHDQINAFYTNLQSPAASTHRDKCRSAPTLGGAAGRDTPTVLATDDEATLYQMGNYDDALCIAHHFFFWNAFVRGLHNGVEYVRGQLHAQSSPGVL
jgi:hypothetical protein